MEVIEGFICIISHYEKIYEGLEKVIQAFKTIDEKLEQIKKAIELARSVSQNIRKLWEYINDFLRRKINLSIWRQMNVNTPEMSFTFPNDFIGNIRIDEEIVQGLKQKNFCYVLSSPQNVRGLILRKIEVTLNNISREPKYKLIIFQPGLFSNAHNQEEKLWYGKIINKINEDLALNCSTSEWIGSNQDIQNNPSLLFRKYIDERIVNNIQDRNLVLVINGVEEIFKPISFRTKFFSIIDYCYSQRNVDEKYNKINFLLFGSADPNMDGDAAIDAAMGINDSTESSITIGWLVNRDEILTPKVKIIKSKENQFWGSINVDKILSDIWVSTDGHPLLTQEIFQQLIRNKSIISVGQESKFVQEQVEHLVNSVMK